jgi:hypothetical protein
VDKRPENRTCYGRLGCIFLHPFTHKQQVIVIFTIEALLTLLWLSNTILLTCQVFHLSTLALLGVEKRTSKDD